MEFSALMMEVSWALVLNSVVPRASSPPVSLIFLREMRNLKDRCDSESWRQPPKGEDTISPTHGAGG